MSGHNINRRDFAMRAQLEHANITVTDATATAAWMCDVFGWHIRWQGPAINDGRTVHVGNNNSYLAIYMPASPAGVGNDSHDVVGGLNHVGVIVDDMHAAETRVRAAGFTPHNHADYEPGRRFYFHDADGIEYEIVQYD
jgi:glyoxylase I family protein